MWHAGGIWTAKNRGYLDVNVGAGLAPAERPARVVEEHGELWIVMHDPDRNEFCLR